MAAHSNITKIGASPEVVLCVDDEAVGLQIRKLILEQQGYSVVTATDTTRALESFKTAHLALVITDHWLGRTTSTAMIAEMKRLNSAVPIIVLSGIAEIPARMENVDVFLSKADGVAPLLDRIKELVRGRTQLHLSPAAKAQPTMAWGETDKLQRLLAAIVESSEDAIFSQTLDGVVMSWNQAAEEMYGYRAEEIISKPISILLHPDRAKEVDNILERLRCGDKLDHFETVRRTKSGQLLPVSLTISPLRDSYGQIIGASTITRDIAQTKTAEQALRSSGKLAIAGRMAATVAHEITNPLESVTNILYLLEQTTTWDETACQFVRAAQDEVEKIRQITKLTLGFHRQSDVQCSEVSIPELIDNVLLLYRRKIQSFGIAVEISYDSKGIVYGNSAELRQVFSNLIINGVDALHETGKKLSVHVFDSCHWNTPSRRGVRVTISDDGPGIPAAARAHIFEPFYTTKGNEGTGMGLWVTRGIVEKYGGTIRARSRIDSGHSGTTFSIFIPAQSLEA
jgi:PAS domain S-box-containing protein